MEFLLIKVLGAIASLMILGQAYASKRVVGFWLNPGSIISLFLFVYTIVPVVTVVQVNIQPLSILFIFVYCVAYSASLLFFDWASASKVNSKKQPIECYVSKAAIKFILFSSSILAFFFILYNTYITLGSLFGTATLLEINATYTSMRYEKDVETNMFSVAGLVFTYIASIFGGLYYSMVRTRKRRLVILLMAFSPSLALILLQGSKGMIFISIAFFVGAILITDIYKNQLSLLTASRIKKTVPYVVVIMVILIFAFYARGLYLLDTASVTDKLIIYFNSYVNGHLYAFSDWFSYYLGLEHKNEYESVGPTFGFYTFMSLFQLLGDSRYVPAGTYGEFLVYDSVLQSNIYTFFRGVITDFGLAGSILFSLLTGFIVNTLFYLLLISRFNALAIVSFVFVTVASYASYLISILTWKNMILVYLLSIALLYSAHVLKKSRGSGL